MLIPSHWWTLPFTISPLGIDFDTHHLPTPPLMFNFTHRARVILKLDPGCIAVLKAFSCFHMTKSEPHTLACRQAVCLVCLPTAHQPALACCALPCGNCRASLTGAHSPLQRHPPLSCDEPSCETGLGLSSAALSALSKAVAVGEPRVCFTFPVLVAFPRLERPECFRRSEGTCIHMCEDNSLTVFVFQLPWLGTDG